MLRKMMLLAAMLAMVLAAAAPAFAQNYQYQYQDQDADSGDVTNEGSGGVDVSGDDNTFEDVNIAQCTAVLNQVNTGNQQTQQAIQQYGYGYAPSGGGVEAGVEGEENQEVSQYADQDSDQYIVQDAALAQYCAQAVGDVTEAAVAADDDDDAAAASSSSSGGGSSSSSSSSSLPATGGISLLTLGAGALVISAGLIARRVIK